jgi:hypothetical protein
MNPWVVIRREIGGAVRSVRYDLANRRNRRGLQEQTGELPVIVAGRAHRRRVILATTAGLAVAGSISGYLVLTGGLDSLFVRGDAPAALPTSRAKPSVAVSPTVAPVVVAPTAKADAKVPMAHNSPVPPRRSVGPSVSPPVPTPAPTCNCVTPSPTGSPSASPSPTPSASSTGLTTAPASAAAR